MSLFLRRISFFLKNSFHKCFAIFVHFQTTSASFRKCYKVQVGDLNRRIWKIALLVIKINNEKYVFSNNGTTQSVLIYVSKFRYQKTHHAYPKSIKIEANNSIN
jgi:hypothetical protein